MTKNMPMTCRMLTGGDVAPDREAGKGMFGTIAGLFREVDFSFVNLEHSLARSSGLLKGKPISHGGKPQMVEGLLEAEFDALTLANNHIMDFGEEAMFETFDVLKAHSIPYTGAGKDLGEAARPVILERNSLKVGLLAYSSTLPQGFSAGPKEPGVNPLRAKTSYQFTRGTDEYPGRPPQIMTWAVAEDLRRMKRDIKNLKKKVNVILVYQHWGTSMTHRVHDFQSEIGRAAIDAGADAVFGGHQHVLSAVEFYRSRPIVHCAGNLIFDIVEPFFTEETLRTFLFGGTLTKEGLCEPYIIPCRCGVKNSPKLLSPHRGEGRKIVETVEHLSAPFGTRLERKDNRVYLLPSV